MPHIILTGHREANPLLPFLPGFRDDFNRPDGALIATADGRRWKVAGSSAATIPRADIAIVGNAAVVVVPEGATGNVVAVAEARSSNIVLDCIVKSVGNRAGSILLRGYDGLDCIEFAFRTSANSTRPVFLTRISGARTAIDGGQAASDVVINDGDRVRLVAEGSTLIAYLNDIPIIACESAVGLTRTGYGIYGYASGPGIAIDSLRVYA